MVALLFGNEGGSFGTAVGIIAVAALVAVLAWGERSFPRWGLYESERELRSVHSLGSQRFPWDMIDRFDQSKTWPKSRVLVVVKNGKVVSIVGTAQGSRIAWDGGETRDIVGVLNERLRAWEAQHGAI